MPASTTNPEEVLASYEQRLQYAYRSPLGIAVVASDPDAPYTAPKVIGTWRSTVVEPLLEQYGLVLRW